MHLCWCQTFHSGPFLRVADGESFVCLHYPFGGKRKDARLATKCRMASELSNFVRPKLRTSCYHNNEKAICWNEHDDLHFVMHIVIIVTTADSHKEIRGVRAFAELFGTVCARALR